SFAISWRLALYQGPEPMRSRALTGAPFESRSTLRYALQVLALCPMPAPSRWHVASAPARPPRFPVALVALETKKLTLGPGLNTRTVAEALNGLAMPSR